MRKQSVALLPLLLTFLNIQGQQTYFQQDISYTIHVELDDVNHRLNGEMDFTYTNNAPEALDHIYMHLWPNAYQGSHTALGHQLLHMDNRNLHDADSAGRGYINNINFKTGSEVLSWTYDSIHPDVAIIKLPVALLPGESITIGTPFTVKLPNGNISRLGHIGQSYQISQWYPKPAVYDHKGWHPMPYLTQGEFYSEFGTFDVYITLPKNYVVGATGDLQNAQEMNWLNELDKRTREMEDIPTNMSFPPSDPQTKTLHYHQEKVHDFAWFADKRYHVLKDTVTLPVSGRTVTTWAMFTGKEAHLWRKAPEYLHDAVRDYSYWLGDYPYNQVTAVDGTISAGGGMEYPNITVIGTSHNAFALENVIVHEVGHNWFYGILGSNERKHPWMDEGLNSFYESRYLEKKYPNLKLSAFTGENFLGNFLNLGDFNHRQFYELMYLFTYRQNQDQPVELHAAEYSNLNYGAIVYSKSALLMHYLKSAMGEASFDSAMHDYYESWKFKHPYPENFREIFEKYDTSLTWMFDTLIPGIQPVNYSIRSVKKDDQCLTESASTGCWNIKIKNKEEVASPFSITALSGDSAIATRWFPGFEKGTTSVNWLITGAEKFRIDADHNLPETNRKNNTIRTTGLFRKAEPLKFKFIGTLENPYRSQVFFAPILGYNVHNQFMFGLAFYNSLVPRKKFEYILAPMYSTGTGREAGLAQLNYRILPRTGLFREIALRVDGKRFALDSSPDAYYSKLAPGIFTTFRGAANSVHRFSLNLQRIQLWEQFSVRNPYTPDDLVSLKGWNSGFTRLNFNWKNTWVLLPTELNLMIEQGEEFVKAFSSFNLSLPYRKSDRKSFDVRFFAGTFLSGRPPVYYQYQLGGNNDYLFEYLLMGRNETSGLFSQQAIPNDGGFRNLPGSVNSGYSMAAINLKASIPKLPLALYADFGLVERRGLTYGAMDAGLAVVLIKNVMEVYFPAVILPEPTIGYSEKIRFILNFNLLNPFEQLRTIEL